MLFVQVFVVVTKKRSSACIDTLPGVTLIAATKFKTTKINFGGLFGLSTKISTHEYYPLYGIIVLYDYYLYNNNIKLKSITVISCSDQLDNHECK